MSDPTKALTEAGLADLCDYLLHSVVVATKEHRAAVVSAAGLLKRQAARIAELEAATRWRPMSEKPVDESDPVIAIDGDYIIFPAYWSGGKLYAVDRHDRIRFVAWLPIPAFEEPKP